MQNAAFSTSESKIWNNFYQGTTPSHIRLVEVADIHTLITKNELTIIVPGTTDTLLARGMYHQNDSNSNYTWWGEVQGGLGSVGIASNEMGKLLHISYSGKSYVYYPLSSRYNAQVELQPSAWDRFQENRADLLVLLTDSRYGTITGLADFYLPAAIVSVGYMGYPRYNFVHEIGHLLGVRHNRVSNMGNEPDDAGCNFGYRFQYFGSSVGYTVMARMTDPGAFRILNFSNPRIELLGSPIGASGSNNSGYLSKNFCSIATKYFDDDELEVDISGPSSIICGGSGTYTAVITPHATGIPGLPPYTYLWGMGKLPFVSLGYPAGSTFLGNPPSVTIQSSSIDFDAYWLFLNIWSSDGVMTSDLINLQICLVRQPFLLQPVRKTLAPMLN